MKHDESDVLVGELYHPPMPSNYKPEELLEHIDVVIRKLILEFPGAEILLLYWYCIYAFLATAAKAHAAMFSVGKVQFEAAKKLY